MKIAGTFREILSVLRHPIESFYKIQDYNGIKNKNETLIERSNYLYQRVCGLTNHNENLEHQVEFFSDLVGEYQRGIKESPDYQSLLAERGSLEKRKTELENLCGLQKKVIRDLKHVSKENLKLYLRKTDDSYQKRAEECDSKLSYIVIGGHGRIVAATLKFLEKFHFEKEGVIGRNYLHVLKSSDKPEFYKDMKKLFGESGKLEKTATIFDGKRKERHILFVRHAPEVVPFVILSELRNLETTPAYFYTRVEVHEIGILKKVEGAFKMFYKKTNGEPEDIQEYIEYKHIEFLKKKDAEFGKIAAEMIAKGVTAIDKIWELSKDAEDFRRRCEEFLLEKQKKSKK